MEGNREARTSTHGAHVTLKRPPLQTHAYEQLKTINQRTVYYVPQEVDDVGAGHDVKGVSDMDSAHAGMGGDMCVYVCACVHTSAGAT